MVIDAGTAGGFNNVFENLIERNKLCPQPEVYRTRMLSPLVAAALLEKIRTTFCDCIVPESMVAVPESAPSIDQSHPVAAPVVVVANGKFGAVYLYFLAPQTFVCNGVMVMDAGAAGGFNAVLENLTARFKLLPQTDVKRTLMLSLLVAAALLVKVKTNFWDCNEPESIIADSASKPTKDQLQPVAAPADAVAIGKFGAVYR